MPTIHVVGLGPGNLDTLPISTHRLLHAGLPVYFRTAVHPVVAQLAKEDVQFTAFDSLYESEAAFADVYRRITETLLAAATTAKEVVYAVPGHPLMAEQTVQNLLADATGVDVRIGPGQSFVDPVCTALRIDPIDGLLLLDGTNLQASQLSPHLQTLIAQVFHRRVAAEVKLTLMEVYSDEQPVTVVRAAGVPELERTEQVALYELDRLDWIDHLTTVYVPASAQAARRDPWTAVALVKRLRQPGGCPWDRKQTHETLRPYVIEEAYEVAHAIDEGDRDQLADELGDLLLQVLLHAQIAAEDGSFALRDVFEKLSEKLVRRHPHVFGDAQARTVEEAKDIWTQQKQAESGSPAGLPADDEQSQHWLTGMRHGRPAAAVAADVQARAAAVGFDWPSQDGVMDKLYEEVKELATAVQQGQEQAVDELGDVVFTLVNLARWLKLDFEAVLSQANQKFTRRFSYVEQRVLSETTGWQDVDLDSLERYWQEAKITGIGEF